MEKRQLPEADKKGIIALAFGRGGGTQSYTRLFQPEKSVTNAQAAIALAIEDASDVFNEELARIEV
ncbi:hypothetical protein AAHE18_08G141200 [Arachis hypogaea]